MTKLSEMDINALRELERIIAYLMDDYGGWLLEELYDAIWDVIEPEKEDIKELTELIHSGVKVHDDGRLREE